MAVMAARLNSGSTVLEYTRFDQLLTQAAVRFISRVPYGRVNPRAAGFEITESRHDLDVPATVAALATAANLADTVAEAEPHFYHYELLKSALSRYRILAARADLARLPSVGKQPAVVIRGNGA